MAVGKGSQEGDTGYPVIKIVAETLDWDVNVDPNFHSQWWRKCEVLREGEWGRVVRLFYHIFYVEGFIVKPGCSYQRQPDEKPFAGKSNTVKLYILWNTPSTILCAYRNVQNYPVIRILSLSISTVIPV